MQDSFRLDNVHDDMDDKHDDGGDDETLFQSAEWWTSNICNMPKNMIGHLYHSFLII